MNRHKLDIIRGEGEGQKIEFKERIVHLDRELVAFANSSGGSIFIGISDDGSIVGVKRTNRLQSQIQDIARNCDPPVNIRLIPHGDNIIEAVVEEGIDKPYRCRDGFFLRIGPNTQKLTRNEIRLIILNEGPGYYDERWNSTFAYPEDFDIKKLNVFLDKAGILIPGSAESILLNLDIAKKEGKRILLNNAGVLFFARRPQVFLKESFVTCVRYRDTERFDIIDRQDIYGNPIECIETAMNFIQRNIRHAQVVGTNLRHVSFDEYPMAALREGIINAVTHRDYFYDASHTYVHIFADRLEIENPGGLPYGLTVKDLGERSVRRNRLVADLLYRAGYIERIGSGIQRMRRVLSENGNPDFEVSSTNFFVLRFFPRHENNDVRDLSRRQMLLLEHLDRAGPISKGQAARFLDVSNDTALREIQHLCARGLIVRQGVGRGTRYAPTGRHSGDGGS